MLSYFCVHYTVFFTLHIYNYFNVLYFDTMFLYSILHTVHVLYFVLTFCKAIEILPKCV